MNFQLIASIIIVIYFTITTALYYRERKNYVIYYRKNSVTFICSLCGLLFCLVLPLNIEFEGPCLVDLWMITLTTFGAILCSLYRGVRMLLLKKKNMFSLKYGKHDSTKVRDQLVELSSFSRNDYGLETNIVDPNNYIKQLNRIIDKGMLRWFFIVPYCTISIVTLVVFIIIYVGDRKNLFEKCINISNALFYPITFFGALILVILPFTHMQLIKLKFKSKWNLKTEMLVNSALLGAGLIFYGLTRMYMSYSTATYVCVTALMAVFSFIQFNTVVVPLLEIREEKKRKARKDYKSIDEFIVSLENKSFLELLKEKAMENFCIENVLLWEAYYDLMLNIKEYYLKNGKKYNVVNSSFYESGGQLEDKSEIIEFNENKKAADNNVTKESIIEMDQYFGNGNVVSNYDINDDKTSYSENFNPSSPTVVQNNNTNMSYSPSASYPIRQNSNFLNSNDKLSPSSSPKPDNQLLNSSLDVNKHVIIKNESQTNIIQTPINQQTHSDTNNINNNNIDITEAHNNGKLEIQIENNSPLQRDGSSLSNNNNNNNNNNNSTVTSPTSPTNHQGISRKTSRTSNDHNNISRVTSIHSTRNNKNSQNNLNTDTHSIEAKNHSNEGYKGEKASYLSKYSKDKESEINHNSKKKSNIATANNSKSLLKYIKSLTLYNYEFDPKFKPLFDQIYYLYIYKDGIAPVILSLNTLTAISNKIDNEEYSYDMYQSAIEEVINILYMNIYPKIE